jgi:hypothetical protein
MEEDGVDWSGVDEKMARQILTQGEIFLSAQLQAALAADARATTMAGLYTTLALATLAGGFGYWDKTSDIAPLLAALVAGSLLAVAAAMAAWAARPIDFYFPGNQPSQWFAGRLNNLVTMIGGEAENYDTRIAYNDARLGENQTAIRRAFIVAIVSPLAGALMWGASSICSSFPG